MAAPRHTRVPPLAEPRTYRSPDHVPASWSPARPGDLDGRQPSGDRLGTPGPDQGYALRIVRTLEPQIRLQPGEQLDDAVRGCLGIALRRASLFGRAPVIHDLRLAFTIWGFFDHVPPTDLVETRRELFEGVADTVHHYFEGRYLADLVPEAVLRGDLRTVSTRYPAEWRTLTGVG